MKNNNYIKVLVGLVIILIISVFMLGLKVLSLNNNKSIYCVMKDNASDNKMEIYYDFKDGVVHRYGVVSTNKMNEDVNIEAYEKNIKISNEKYKGSINKFWSDDEVYITTEIYDLELLTENEFKEMTGISIKELKSKTRKEIIDSMIPMMQDGNLTCN